MGRLKYFCFHLHIGLFIGNAICLTKSAPTGDKLTPYPADFIQWWNVRCRFYVTAHAVQQSSDADFYPYTQSTASMILV